MLKKIRKSTLSFSISVIILAAILLLSSVMTGCSTPVSAAEVNASAIASHEKISSLKYDMTMNLDMSLSIKGKTENFVAEMDATAVVDNTNKEMQLDMTMDVNFPQEGKQQLKMAEYLVGDWVYINMGLPGMGETWVKTAITEEMWASQNQAYQQIEFLKTASQVELIGSEKIDGVDCYVEELTPDMAQLFDWAMSQMQSTGTEDLDLGQVNPGNWFKNVVIKLWIAKESRLIMKEDISMEMNISAKDMGLSEDATEGIKAKIAGQMKFYDYNQPALIVLPLGAYSAIETPNLN